MQEILPGIHHWTAFHEGIKMDVSSYYVEPAGALIDPMLPRDGGLEWFEARETRPQQILLTNRHHYRHSDRFRQAFDLPVRCSMPGLHEFEDGGPEVEGFEFGDVLAPGIAAIEIGGICPDDTALHIELAEGVVAFADALIHYGGALGFVPDGFMDDPPRDKQAMMESFRGLLERDFDHILVAHGEPLVGGGKAALRDFVNKPVAQDDPGSTA
jgi:glyoxylase-like metal-dependent hydrolase (beta-lactamase superfamily II)